MKKSLKDARKVTIIVAMLLLVTGLVLTFSNHLVWLNAEEGLVVYDPVNFRKKPSTESKIIDEIDFGKKVRVLNEEDGWLKVKYDGNVGYVVSESVTMKRVMLDISDYNWGNEYNSIKEFKEFTERAQESTKFAGYYIQVLRADDINENWQEIVEALDEMKVPYGLYMYTSASTEKEFKVEYNHYEKLVTGVDLKYNKYPFMIDLENGKNQTEVIEYLQDNLGEEFVVYANANTMTQYGYHEMVEQYWVAHYEIRNNIPFQDYAMHEKAIVGLEPVIWQYTNEGSDVLFGTTHLDVNVVDEDWYQKYN